MKSYRIVSVEPVRYPVLNVTFDDGLAGELDLTGDIDNGTLFEPLKDRSFFDKVSIGENGRAVGWNLDHVGHEIDLGADSIRIDLETRIVHELAERFRSQRTAAE
ncbi:DUF2442 domain-containing protein [Kaistia dalseonensis]|uniref:DUF2442 domain-containing protein n=1 Tax=Kaistia dalseonensis TaxID=410840 RepID=A0ABU0H3M6_9HYPH|nr:DUF2442 domain-containing protein [Kaistia dalseonensis]MCX5494331.1 DUF2442 domain-containing protein [Kaistia dalseonensis]MDQ0436912.1 hypothetical protein [Kaistia dalseonensis]